MTKPRLPGAHETPTPSDEGEPFVVLLVGDEYEEGERMADPSAETLRREVAILLEEAKKVDAQRLRQAMKDSALLEDYCQKLTL